ncbi:mitochondrial calcium uniporter regulator 1 isoform X1 [Clarias gariepinus]|uniref:mitochondrial calcium uniporter regulator 1 isoform X1 n=1 Tax=Clarias gariepinus TaxID=13013 RepID=UPI00234C567D|nr:mitochondrial calcium uniporter regulator 1 isoform X1 [Clarias gariepinus]
MFLGRCNSAIIWGSFAGTSKHFYYYFDVKQGGNRRLMAPLLSVVTQCWRVCPAFCRIFTLRRVKGKTQRLFNRSGPDTGSLWKGVRWSIVRELSTSSKVMQYDLAKSGHRKLLFDTHAMVQLLEESGLTIQQAEVIVKVLRNTTDTNMDVMYSDMVTKTQQEIMLQKVMSHIAAVKKDMIILEKSEFSALLAENERIKVELAQVTMQLSDMLNKVRLNNKLDVNLDKSQVKEMKAEHEKKILVARNHMMEMLADQDRLVTQSKMKIDTEVAGLKTMLESHKLDSIKYLAGSVFTCLTVVLGFFRIWM